MGRFQVFEEQCGFFSQYSCFIQIAQQSGQLSPLTNFPHFEADSVPTEVNGRDPAGASDANFCIFFRITPICLYCVACTSMSPKRTGRNV